MTRGPSGVSGFTAASWRASNPSWNGGYYYHGGAYYYDSGFGYPALITNEWGAIAAVAGGVALIGLLNNDPTLVFAGSVGALYAVSQYDTNLSGSGELHMRAEYFHRPYFWRNGVRYDRFRVISGGSPYYEFRIHVSV